MTDPQDVKSEEALLGAILVAPDSAKTLTLDAEDFYRPRHGLIWAASVKCAHNGGCDAITVAAELDRRGQLTEIGGRERLAQLAATVPAAGNAKAYAKRVRETAELRKIRRSAMSVLEAVEKNDETAIAEALQALGHPIKYVDTASGEVVDSCPTCEDRDKIIKEKERRISGLELSLANKRRDRHKAMLKDPLYLEALTIFDWWRIACRHPDVEFTYEEFELIAPHLRQAPKKTSHYRCLEAIAGAAFNPFETQRKNGTTNRNDDWEQIFRNRGKVRGARNRAPKENWQRWLLNWIEAQFA